MVTTYRILILIVIIVMIKINLNNDIIPDDDSGITCKLNIRRYKWLVIHDDLPPIFEDLEGL